MLKDIGLFAVAVVTLVACGAGERVAFDAGRALRCGAGTRELAGQCVVSDAGSLPCPVGTTKIAERCVALDAGPIDVGRFDAGLVDAGRMLSCAAGTIEVDRQCLALDAGSGNGAPRVTCAAGTVEVDQQCVAVEVPACTTNDACPATAVCQDHVCRPRPSCVSTADCSDPASACVAGQCMPKCDAAICSSVHAGLVCADRLAVPVCLPQGSFADSPCRAAPASACDSFPLGLRCVDGQCAIDCSETDKWRGYGQARCKALDAGLQCSAPAGYVCVPQAAPVLNPTAAENTRPGSSDWTLENPALAHEIEGYASLTSVDKGQNIAFYVSTSAANYSIDVYRMGYYAGLGARQVNARIRRAGHLQVTPVPNSAGTVECDWTDPYALQIPGDWVSGVYLAKLTEDTQGKQSYIVFVVRDDARVSDYLFQSSVTTYQAYNNWGGKSLYDFNSQGEVRASKVSFNRPYGLGLNVSGSARGLGAGDFLTNMQSSDQTQPVGWEYPMLRFLEREGYDVTYATNVDTHEQPNLLANRKAFLSVGHDEYWSWRMRDQVETARDRFGTQLGFFSGNDCYWQIRFEPDAHGAASRTMVGYKDETTDPAFGTSDTHLTTTRWALLPLSSSEAAFVGVRYQAAGVYDDLVVDDDTSWPLAGTGLRKGDHLAGLLGYEVDGVTAGLPAGMTRIMHSPWSTPNEAGAADMVTFSVPSGAWTFAAGSIQFAWGLDDFGNTNSVNEAARQLTRNVLARFAAARAPSTTAVLLADDFAGPQRDAARWSLGVVSEGALSVDANVSVVQNGNLSIAPRSKLTGLHHNGIVSARTWDMTDGAAVVELVQAPNAASSADASFAVSIDASRWVRFSVESGSLIFQANAAGTITKQSVAYNPAQQRFLRLRHEHKTEEFLWETSPDGQAFTVVRRSPNTLDVSAMRIELEAGTYQSETAPGSVVFDNFGLEWTGFTDDFAGTRRAQYWLPNVLSDGSAMFDPEMAPIQFGGRLTLRPRSGVAGLHEAGYVSARAWDLTGGEAVAEVSQIAAAGAQTAFALAADAANWLRFQTQNGSLSFQDAIGGTRTQTSVTYDAVAHRYWRLAHAAGSQLWTWSTSPDGNTWTIQRSRVAPWSTTQLRAELMAGSSQLETAPGEARFESFRLRQGKFAP